MISDRHVSRLFSACLPVWRRAGYPVTGIVFEVICRAWGIEDRRVNPESYEATDA